ncbi:MAG: hypothetical protein AAF327_18060 [Cyanobacteria bacterium P01_A01_bin.37]
MSDEQDVQPRWVWGYRDPGIAKRSENIPNDAAWGAEESLQSFIVPALKPEVGRASNLRSIVLWAVKQLILAGGWLTLIHWLLGLFSAISYAIIGFGILPPLLAIAFGVWVCRRDKATTGFVWISGLLIVISISFFAIHL